MDPIGRLKQGQTINYEVGLVARHFAKITRFKSVASDTNTRTYKLHLVDHSHIQREIEKRVIYPVNYLPSGKYSNDG